MNFENDIYISYAHLDDASGVDGANGWVTEFHQALKVKLAQLLGRRLQIWRDDKLQDNDFFTTEMESQFRVTKIMICIITPRYVESEWCLREVDLFYRSAEQAGGVVVENRSRIFKIMKTPVSLEDQPEKLRTMVGYPFFNTDAETGSTKEFGVSDKIEYWSILDDVANDVAQLIEKLK